MAVDELDGQQTSTHEITRPVDIGEDQIEQLGPIDDTGFDGRPLRAREHDRDGVERPSASPRIRRPERVVRHTVGIEKPVDVTLAAQKLIVAELSECGADVRPGRPHRSVGFEELVIGAGVGAVVGQHGGVGWIRTESVGDPA